METGRDITYDDPIFGEYAKANEILKYKQKPLKRSTAALVDENEPTDDSIRPKGINLIAAEIFVLFQHEESSPYARILSFIITLVIILAIGSYIFASLNQSQYTPTTCDNPACDNNPILCPGTQICAPIQTEGFNFIELLTAIFFLIEYGSRLLTCWAVSPRLAGILPAGWDKDHEPDDQPSYGIPMRVFRYMTRTMNLIDLIAIMPYYLGLAIHGGNESFFKVLRLFRLVRVLRLLRLLTFLKNVEVTLGMLAVTVVNSFQILAVFMFFVIICIVLFGCVIYLAEAGEFMVTKDYPAGAFLRLTAPQDGLMVSAFDSIPTGMWWSVCPGGSINPNTDGGRTIFVLLYLVCLFGLAFPVSIIAIEFERAYSHECERLLRESNASKQLLRDDLAKMRGTMITTNPVTQQRKRLPPTPEAANLIEKIDRIIATEKAKMMGLQQLLDELILADNKMTEYKDSLPKYDELVVENNNKGSWLSRICCCFGGPKATASDDGSGGCSGGGNRYYPLYIFLTLISTYLNLVLFSTLFFFTHSSYSLVLSPIFFILSCTCTVLLKRVLHTPRRCQRS